MNPDRKRWLVRGLKAALACVILLFVGAQFYRDLEQVELSEIDLRPEWLIASGVLYLAGLFPSAWFWRHLHVCFGYPISLYVAVRAHFVGQLGKYVPGKAMAIAIRSELVRASGVPYGVSVIASFYEVFTGMAAGAIVAAGIYAFQPPEEFDLAWHPLALGLVLIGLCGVPLLPGVFNFVIAKLTARVQLMETYRLPPVQFGTLATGLLTTGVGWWLHGLSTWALLQAVLPDPPGLSVLAWAQCTAGIAFANVAGFVIVVAPAGLGVREYLLRMLLGTFGPGQYIAVAVLLLRLDWIAAEMVFALATWWAKPKASGP